ncbi:MAG: hypothetical protein OXL36_21255 [Bryobacterales bacterium]|nr:hypothetical protein [Bryobacterales bacterium]MDE0292935.1 hypothetical protein [Bryobacterales bacterium]
MKTLGVLLVAALLASIPLAGQDLLGGRRDFLTDHEADLIRVNQEPEHRIGQYLHFARLRIELVRQALLREDAGRSKLIHRNIEEYGRIIEAIDFVIDDAAADQVDLADTLKTLAEREKEFLAALERILENPAGDHWTYEFVLEDAIEITRDSMELTLEDLGDRGRRILEADAREKKRQRALMTPERRKDVEKLEKKVQTEEQEQKSKSPTLLKPGETLEKKPR